jgi:hypothetical protein
MTGRPGRILGAGIAVVALLSACSDDAQPAPSPSLPAPSASDTGSTPAGSATPTASKPTASVPPLPPEARASTSEGATAFVQHWFALVNYAYVTAETAPLIAASAGACGFCSSFAADIEEAKSARLSLEGGQFTVHGAATPGLDSDGRALVDANVSQEAVTELAADGATVEQVPSVTSAPLLIALIWDGVEWKVEGVDTSP